jgi:hypothetical protein
MSIAGLFNRKVIKDTGDLRRAAGRVTNVNVNFRVLESDDGSEAAKTDIQATYRGQLNGNGFEVRGRLTSWPGFYQSRDSRRYFSPETLQRLAEAYHSEEPTIRELEDTGRLGSKTVNGHELYYGCGEVYVRPAGFFQQRIVS